MQRSQALQLYRIFFGLLALSGVITELVVLMNRGDFIVAHFFGYFTILSNCLAGAWLLYNGLTATSRRRPYVLVRGAITLYMLMTGVIFSILLAPVENAVLTAVPWDNIVLHYIMPIAVVLDWFWDPPKAIPSFKRALLWLLFPAVYVVYSLVYGSIHNWYPYPFLNATKFGYGHVLTISIIMFVGILAGILVLLRGPRLLRMRVRS